MINIMNKNIKKTALSLLVVGLAIGAQSFTSVTPKTTNFYYGYDVVTGTYRLISGTPDQENNCEPNDNQACVVGTELQIPQGFTPSDVISDPDVSSAINYQSPDKGEYFHAAD